MSSWALRLLCEFQKIRIFVSKPVGHRECFNTQNVMVKRTCSEYLFTGDTQQSPVQGDIGFVQRVCFLRGVTQGNLTSSQGHKEAHLQ